MSQNSDAALIRTLSERVSTLEEQLRQATEVLRGDISALPESWGLRHSFQRLLIALARAPGGFLTSRRALWLLSKEGAIGDPDGLLRGSVYKIRRQTERLGIVIITRVGVGLEMPEKSRAIVRAAAAMQRDGE